MEIEQGTPAATRCGRGCSSSEATALVRRFEIGQTSRTIGAIRELADERGILDGADAVPDPLGAERLERAADRRRPGDLAGVRHRREPLGAGDA